MEQKKAKIIKKSKLVNELKNLRIMVRLSYNKYYNDKNFNDIE